MRDLLNNNEICQLATISHNCKEIQEYVSILLTHGDDVDVQRKVLKKILGHLNTIKGIDFNPEI